MWFLVTVDMLKCMHVDDQPAQNVAIYLQAVPDNAVLVVQLSSLKYSTGCNHPSCRPPPAIATGLDAAIDGNETSASQCWGRT